eukprot:TRINITY_DN10572_c0_g1_i3.p1 TRINITY_DN10572_c0_g1~~TRINITY_DN10572_c0_g1_i3.p1  ORF type:complete len:181 (-),score=41.78 TRINITY_DN10572_c0_g1_i3:1130-1672(-)
MTLLQMTTKKKASELQELQSDKQKLSLTLDLISRMYPTHGKRLREVISMLLEGERIDQVARTYEEGEKYHIGLTSENFKLRRDLKKEQELIDLVNEKIEEPLAQIVTKLIRNANLREIQDQIDSLPSQATGKISDSQSIKLSIQEEKKNSVADQFNLEIQGFEIYEVSFDLKAKLGSLRK